MPADGTVDLMIPDSENYSMRGPDLLHLSIDPKEIYSSNASASQIPENAYNYSHWFMGPYSVPSASRQAVICASGTFSGPC
jgi:hypothetical protein